MVESSPGPSASSGDQVREAKARAALSDLGLEPESWTVLWQAGAEMETSKNLLTDEDVQRIVDLMAEKLESMLEDCGVAKRSRADWLRRWKVFAGGVAIGIVGNGLFSLLVYLAQVVMHFDSAHDDPYAVELGRRCRAVKSALGASLDPQLRTDLDNEQEFYYERLSRALQEHLRATTTAGAAAGLFEELARLGNFERGRIDYFRLESTEGVVEGLMDALASRAQERNGM